MTRLRVPSSAAGQRLDHWLAGRLAISRSRAQQLLRTAGPDAAGRPLKPGLVLRGQEVVNVIWPPVDELVVIEPPELAVIFQDQDVVVVDKPAGLLTHPGAGRRTPTVADFARLVTTDPDGERPGIVHRLDSGTSGVMIIARTPEAKRWLQRQFHDRLVEKTYLALATGHPRPPVAIIRLPLGRSASDRVRRAPVSGGLAAETRYQVVEDLPGYSLLAVKPTTGRTHQVRAHLSAIGHPLAGDVRYGAPAPPTGLTRPFLHASILEIMLPSGQRRTFSAPLPPALAAVLEGLRKGV